jgi:hypothetical protein
MSPAGPEVYAFPLSANQYPVWLQENTQELGSAYHMTAGYRVVGQVHLEALAGALRALVDRHEALRTVFRLVDGAPKQVVTTQADVRVNSFDWRDRAGQGTREQVRAIVEEPFDLVAGPLLRAAVARTAHDEYLFVLVVHHLVADGRSLGLMGTELIRLYHAAVVNEPAGLAPLSFQYPDFTLWQRDALRPEALAEQVAYWRVQLEGMPAQLELPTDRTRPAIPDYTASSYEFDVGADTAAGLQDLAKRCGATLYMVLLSAFQVLLARYSGQERFVIGAVSGGRQRVEFEGVVGLFASAFPLPVELSGRPTFTDLVGRTRHRVLDALGRQDVPFDRLVTELAPPRQAGVPPIFQTVFQVLYDEQGAVSTAGGARFEPVTVDTERMPYDLVCTMVRGDGLRCGLQWRDGLYDRAGMLRIADNLAVLLSAVRLDPDRVIWHLPLLGDRERATLAEWSRGSCRHCE